VAETTRKNTDARMRGGAARSSDEAPVMGVEPRGSVIRLTNVANPLCGDERQERLDNGSRVNREVSARFFGGAQGEIPWAYSPSEVSVTTRPEPEADTHFGPSLTSGFDDYERLPFCLAQR
jgi:hypothetical protein